MAPNSEEPVQAYQLRQEYLRGQIDAMSFLIEQHEYSIREALRRNQSTEQG
jgi:hypothetical protein